MTTPSDPGDGERRLSPVTALLAVLDRSLVFPVVALVFGAGRSRFAWVFLLLAGLTLVSGVVRWRRTTWVVTSGALRVRSGLLARQEQVVPLDRVQQVTVVEDLRHRLFGVAALRVEVAGGGSSVALDPLDRATATAVRQELLAVRSFAADALDVALASPPPPAPERLVVALGLRQLAVAGVTGVQLLVLFAILASGVELLGDLPGRPLQRLLDLRLGAPGLAGALLAGVVLVALWLGTAVGASILRDGGFRLTIVGDDLHLERGLLERRQAVLPIGRLQAVRLTASPLRRALGLTSVRFQSAGRGTDEEERRIVVPVLPVAEVGRVLDLVLPDLALGDGLPGLTAPPPAARRRQVVRAVGPWAAVTVVIAAAAWPWGTLAALGLPLALALGLARYRALGHAWSGSALVTRQGAVVRRTVLVRGARAQSARVRASPFQRRVSLSTVLVDVAGPGTSPRVVDEAASTATRLQRALVTRDLQSSTTSSPVATVPGTVTSA